MRAMTWAVFGSLVINLLLGVAIGVVFSAPPLASAATAGHCSRHPAMATSSPPPAAPRSAPVQRYIVAVRMGWAI